MATGGNKSRFRILRAMRMVWGSGRGWTLASIGLVVVQAMLVPLSLYLMKLVVDDVTAIAGGSTAVSFHRVVLRIILMTAAGAGGVICGSLSLLVNEALGQTVTDHVQDVLHSKSVEVDLEYYENPEYHDILHRAQQESPYRPIYILRGLVQAGQNGLSLLLIGGLLLVLHWGILAVLLAASVPGVLVRLRYADKLYNWSRRRTVSQRLASYLHWLLTADSHAKEIRLFGLGELLMGRFRDLRRTLRKEKVSVAAKQSLADLATQLAATAALCAALVFIAQRAAVGAISLGGLFMYFTAFQRGQQFLHGLLSSLAGLYENNLFLADLEEFLSLKPTLREPASPREIPPLAQKGIVFENVSFAYPGGSKILDNICIEVRPGETVALVGENGAGKTTLIKLLCRLYDPTAGKITMEGVDLKSFPVAQWRRQISVVFQDYARYHLSAKENIWLGDILRPPSPEEMIAAAKRSGADEIIRGLSHGYETMLGKWFEGGEELSLGQWQKVALARAFWKNAPIVVLDEPTSALDAKAEYEVFKKFHQLSAGRTAILISHRLSTVKMASRVYVLEHGRLVESGSHDQLVQCGGAYARLFETQAQYYR